MELESFIISLLTKKEESDKEEKSSKKYINK